MQRLPTESTLKCIVPECDDKPTGLLKGKHEGKKLYEVQIMHCGAHLPEARKYSRSDWRLLQVSFSDEVEPPWLKRAQRQELELRKIN